MHVKSSCAGEPQRRRGLTRASIGMTHSKRWIAGSSPAMMRVETGIFAACLGLGFGTGAQAQTYGFATLPPGTLNHTTASAVSKVLKEKAGLNVLVQPTAGDNIIVPMVARGEAEIGIANVPEVASAIDGGRLPEVRLIGTVHPLRTA